MREDILKKARSDYQHLLKLQESFSYLYDLSANSITADTNDSIFTLIEARRTQLLDIDDVVKSAITPYVNEIFDKKIYIHIGSFLDFHEKGELPVFCKGSADIHRYRLLTTNELLEKDRYNYQEFEENNEVLFIKGTYDNQKLMERYKFLQYSYFKQILDGFSEEEALQVLKKHL